MGLKVTIGQKDAILFAGGIILHIDKIDLTTNVVSGTIVYPDGGLSTFNKTDGSHWTVFPGIGLSLTDVYHSSRHSAQVKFTVHAPKTVQVQRAHTSHEGDAGFYEVANKFYFDDVKKFYTNWELLKANLEKEKANLA